MAVQARLTSTSHQDNNHECSAKRMVITEDHVKEGLQRSHILYDRAGEEHYNCISALHKSMRGSDENASLYWLARMLEGGEDPLYVARRLVRFASEDIGQVEKPVFQVTVLEIFTLEPEFGQKSNQLIF
ncbi:hypothetical protein Chor_003122 [Crotalus horridus]